MIFFQYAFWKPAFSGTTSIFSCGIYEGIHICPWGSKRNLTSGRQLEAHRAVCGFTDRLLTCFDYLINSTVTHNVYRWNISDNHLPVAKDLFRFFNIFTVVNTKCGNIKISQIIPDCFCRSANMYSWWYFHDIVDSVYQSLQVWQGEFIKLFLAEDCGAVPQVGLRQQSIPVRQYRWQVSYPGNAL